MMNFMECNDKMRSGGTLFELKVGGRDLGDQACQFTAFPLDRRKKRGILFVIDDFKT